MHSHLHHYQYSGGYMFTGFIQSATPGTNYWHTRMSKRVCDRRMSWAKRVFASKHPGEKATKNGGHGDVGGLGWDIS